MNEPHNTSFAARLKAAAEAKKAMLAKFKAKPAVTDPHFEERAAMRAAELEKVRQGRAAAKAAAKQALADAEDAARSTGLFAQSEAAAGAKSDAMLYDRSFDGSTLNSLGQVKLDLILKATPGGQPVVVYLVVPHDSLADRQATVTAYLKNAGVPDGLIKTVEGPNTNTTTPTEKTLSSIYKADGSSFTGEDADSQVPTAAAATK